MNIEGNRMYIAYLDNPRLYGSGNAIQHLHYLPFGEDWVDQRNSSWNAPYTFSGKEKDVETGYGYFGARYYDSGLSIWLSVDPMSDKYPSMSPYNYCANNPVILVDPDGRDIYSINDDGSIILYKETDSKTDYYCWGDIKLDEKGKITNKYVAINKNKASDKSVIMSEGISDTRTEKNVPYYRYDFNNSSDAATIYNFIIDNDIHNNKNGAKNELSLNIMSENGKAFGILTSGGRRHDEPGSSAVLDWFKENQKGKGLVWISSNHNHPSGSNQLSDADIKYAATVRSLQTSPIKFTLNPKRQRDELYQKKISF